MKVDVSKEEKNTMMQHMQIMNLRHESIVKMWRTDGVLCVQYLSGNWWHYNEKGEWW